MAKMFQILAGTKAINPFDSKLFLFQKNMWKEIVKILQPFLQFLFVFYSNQVHSMLVIMLDLQFKLLQVMENLVGCGNAIWLVSKYDLKAMIPLLMICFETLNPIAKTCTSTIHDDLEKVNMFKVWASFEKFSWTLVTR
jgi:hypothetical protein